MLAFPQETYFVLNYANGGEPSELDALSELITKTYGNQRPFEFLLERANDTYEVYYVQPEDITEDMYEYRKLNDWLDGDGDERWLLDSILNDLCFRGLIPAGNYLISISW